MIAGLRPFGRGETRNAVLVSYMFQDDEVETFIGWALTFTVNHSSQSLHGIIRGMHMLASARTERDIRWLLFACYPVTCPVCPVLPCYVLQIASSSPGVKSGSSIRFLGVSVFCNLSSFRAFHMNVAHVCMSARSQFCSLQGSWRAEETATKIDEGDYR